jgi:hypothetical protein
MAWQLIVRFVIGGAVVAAFAALGDILRPKSFAGLFGAAPSVALATLGLTVLSKGHAYAAIEARSMIIGAVAFALYAQGCAWCMLRRSYPSMAVTLIGLLAWVILAFSGWWVLRALT